MKLPFVLSFIFDLALSNRSLRYTITVLLICVSFALRAQSEIPLGTWRAHVSFNSIIAVAVSDQNVFGAAHNGILVLDKSDNSIRTYSKIDGLHGTGITSINYDETTKQLLIGYQDGKIDIIKDNHISLIDPARNSDLTGSKKINHITIRENLGYLAADYGVVIVDLIRKDVKETWRDIGSGGQTAKVFKSTFKGDTVFLATDNGVIAGDLNTNLLDFNFWKHFNTGEFEDSIQSIEAFNNKVYASIKGVGLYRYEGGQWTKEMFFQNEPLQSLDASATNSLMISSGNTLWQLTADNLRTPIVSEKITQPHGVIEDRDGMFWIADNENGIVSNYPGAFVNYMPNGPSNASPKKLFYHKKRMYALDGGYAAMLNPLRFPGNIDHFIEGTWTTKHSTMLDLTDIAFDDNSNRVYVSSFGYGVEERDDQNSIGIFNENNSPLINTNPPLRFVNITAIEQAQDGLWVANYNASKPLHFLTGDNSWLSYAFTQTPAQYPLELALDFYNNVWLRLNPEQGGGVLVFNKEKNTSSYLTTTGGSGGLPHKSVRCIAMDRDGIVWLGTDEGVCYFADLSSIFSPGINAVKPIFEDRFLLRDDKVTAIAIDGGNRKWIGTERGVWLFNPSGEELIYNFTADNSPLLSNVILDIEVNDYTGEVFIATDHGLASFRSDATESDFQFGNVKIFPNPVSPEFSGTVGISGLATDAIVKITDITGKMVWETRANGGTASWTAKDSTGKRVSTGVYLVFSASAEGAESVVGKIAVVE